MLQVVTLLGKMEQLRGEPLDACVHAIAHEWVEAVKALQQCRQHERISVIQQLRGDFARVHDEKGKHNKSRK